MTMLLLVTLLACSDGWDRSTIGERAGSPERGQGPDSAGQPLDGEAGEAWLELTSSVPCTDPCTFTASASTDVIEVEYVVDGWSLGSSHSVDFALTYDFQYTGYRELELLGLDAYGNEIAHSLQWITVLDPEPEQGDAGACSAYTSSEQEYAPVQTTGSGLPSGWSALEWLRPSDYTYTVAFSGTPGYAANHEGMDYVHGDSSVGSVPVYAAAPGTVVYVRLGCPQSSTFSHNNSARECGAGWGNHVVVDHGGLLTRYAHLDPSGTEVRVGDSVTEWTRLGWMGNTGRSELRHLHFELGTGGPLDPCDAAQSFERVYDPADLF
jgi:hypothetical protein